MNAFDAMTGRTSVNFFDTTRPVSTDEVLDILTYAQEAPTAFNIQHTRYLVVTDPDAKETLKEIAFGQQKVADAPVVVLVLADNDGHKKMPEIAQRGVDAGVYPQQAGDYMVNAVNGSYAGDAQKCHDEALRSASMATMNLMTAATAKGLATGPMIGFDAARLKQTFNIGDQYDVAMMVTLGYAREGNWARKPRLSAGEVTVLDARPGQAHSFS
ncbi:MAG: nitroreductase family protein [Oceanospirillaceae bacterium]|nr:nitroreductase family protein [Oceanospirillaceae bacterium]MBT11949.1 nitroreductase family protein [Oceanospirillaceae bacterium]|tara:strand:+ start:36434 stop:37075 length:642 start_codon:yes stop_codon:yes gene_type:complete